MPPTYERWMDDDDEKELLEASSTNITADDTAIFCTSDSDYDKGGMGSYSCGEGEH